MTPPDPPARGHSFGQGRPINPGLRAKRRGALVRSAYEVLTERGYQRTSLSDIARHAGVGQGTIYRYFDSKRELLDHVFDYAVAKAARAINIGSIADAGTCEKPLELVSIFGQRLFALVDGDPAILRVITVESSAVDAELRYRVTGLFGALDANLALLIEKLAGDVDPGREVWTMLARMMMGLAGPGLAMSVAGEGSEQKRTDFLTMMKSVASQGLFGIADDDAKQLSNA